MSVEVVTVWAPRPKHPKWRDDYMALLNLQKRSVERYGHKHLVVTDSNQPSDFRQLRQVLPDSLMKAMIAGVLARLCMPVESNLLFVDADCLVIRTLDAAFADETPWDIALTRRDDILLK